MMLRIWAVLTFVASIAMSCLSAPQADAQAARSVLMRLCNDTGFDAGVMAAFQTGASTNRTLQGWFLVPAGTCIEGGLDGVAGSQIGLHAFSGEWRWPEFDLGQSWCVPANGGRRPGATTPPCNAGEQPARFEPTAIRRYRAGWGVVDYRFSCDAFAGDDRAWCQTTPQARDGMAEPVRELEVCNCDQITGRYSLAHDEAGGRFHVEGWRDIAAGACETVYRGFPADGQVYIRLLAGESVDNPRRAPVFGEARSICHNPSAHFDVTAPRPSLVSAQTCPADAPDLARFQAISFQSNVSRFTHTVHTLN